MTDLQVPVNPRGLLVHWLRAQPEMAALVSGRIYTRWPATKEWPAVRVSRVAGGAVHGHQDSLHDPLLQFDIGGGTLDESAAHEVAVTVSSLLERRLRGVIDVGGFSAVVTGVEVGSIHEGFDPTDEDLAVARLDARVWLRPR